MGAASSAADARDHHPHRVAEWSAFLLHPEGIFPAAGYRCAERLGAGGAGYFLRCDEDQAEGVQRYRDAGSGRGKRGRLRGGSGSTSNSGHMFISLKPLSQRKASADQVIARLRRKLAVIPGATLFLQANQDIRMGGRRSNAEYQYTLESENLADLDAWTPRVLQRLKKLPQLRDVSTDQEDKGLETSVAIDRDTASRLGISTQAIDGALYDAFGQRQVSTMYDQLNEYHVVMTVAPAFQENSDALKGIYVQSSNGAEVPLSAFSHFHAGTTTLAVNHQG